LWLVRGETLSLVIKLGGFMLEAAVTAKVEWQFKLSARSGLAPVFSFGEFEAYTTYGRMQPITDEELANQSFCMPCDDCPASVTSPLGFSSAAVLETCVCGPDRSVAPFATHVAFSMRCLGLPYFCTRRREQAPLADVGSISLTRSPLRWPEALGTLGGADSRFAV